MLESCARALSPMEDFPEELHEHPISDELDLHTFRPSELAELLEEYFRECRERGLLKVRVIHGKGTGALRAGVHALLERMPEVVAGYAWPAGDSCGSWGATWVYLKPLVS
jgi:DNA-nicking Smr family endonuclease